MLWGHLWGLRSCRVQAQQAFQVAAQDIGVDLQIRCLFDGPRKERVQARFFRERRGSDKALEEPGEGRSLEQISSEMSMEQPETSRAFQVRVMVGEQGTERGQCWYLSLLSLV